MITHTFQCMGREYTLFRAKPTEEWKLRIQINGQRIKRSCGSRMIAQATKAAQAMIKEASLGQVENVLALRRRRPAKAKAPVMVSQFLDAYRNMTSLENQPATRIYNARECMRYLQFVFGDLGDVRLNVLSANTAHKFWDAAGVEASAIEASVGQAAAQAYKRSTNSWYRHVRSCFMSAVVEPLRRDGMNIPDLRPWLDAGKARMFRRVIKTEYFPPSRDIVQRALEQWKVLPDRNMFLAIGLGLAAGLRAGEVAQAKWGWVQDLDGPQQSLVGSASVKGATGSIRCQVLTKYWGVLWDRAQREGWVGRPGDFMLSGSKTERSNLVFRRISAWMRHLGWRTQKTFHEFRALSAADVIVEHGYSYGSIFLRHGDLQVVQRYYSRYVEMILAAKKSQPPSNVVSMSG